MFRTFCLFVLFFALICSCMGKEYRIDTAYPGGNIIVDSVQGHTVQIHQDMRDSSGKWFYWSFRVFGAEGETLHFQFTKRPPLSTRGPAFSRDGGKSWKWLGPCGQKRDQFDFTFTKDDHEVRFSVGIPYTQFDLEEFLSRYKNSPFLKKEILTRSKKDRAVEMVRISDFQAGEKKIGIVLTGTHHACEQIALYTAEGILETALSDTETGKWFRKNTEIRFVPFIDKDGVEDGDQGKNRIPHDPNRDYIQEIYPSVKALKKMIKSWESVSALICFDFHCPELYDDPPSLHQMLFFTPPFRKEMLDNLKKFSVILAKIQKGKEYNYEAVKGVDGKTYISDMKTQKTFATWAGEQKGALLGATLEVPYANIEGKECSKESLREFG
ncbi:MAG: M14 family zinc carboxypeptidase, partial [Planctomycetia bacterium]|nr:M14 family zinc carboxypeptidase [Planctomycetia bacterium]